MEQLLIFSNYTTIETCLSKSPLPLNVQGGNLKIVSFEAIKMKFSVPVFGPIMNALFDVNWMTSSTTAFIYFSQGSPISPLRTVINRSPVHPKNYKIQYNLKILKRNLIYYNLCTIIITQTKGFDKLCSNFLFSILLLNVDLFESLKTCFFY